MHKVSLVALLAASSLATAAARADVPTYSFFTITSVTDPNFSTATFTLPGAPTPAGVDPLNGDFTVAANVTVDGTVYAGDPLQFFTSAAGGGVVDNYFFFPYGPQLFKGTLNAPTFFDGTFNLSDNSNLSTHDYTLSVSSTPEPSSLMLLGTGALGLAGVARRRFIK